MKVITKEEWGNTPQDYKKVYNDTMYMLYKESDGSMYFGPVKVVKEDNIKDIKRNN